MRAFYNGLIIGGTHLQPIVLLAIRLFCGYFLYESGMAKLANIPRVTDFFDSLHIPFPTLNAYLVGGIEAGCGVLLVVGLATRLAAMLLTIVLLAALLIADWDAVHGILKNPAAITEAAPFLYLYSTVVLFCWGPGMLSLDALLKRFVFKVKGVT